MSLFPAKVEDQADARAGGRCEDCGGLLKPGKYQYDHIKPRGFGGDNSLQNCLVRCVRCHLKKTMDDDMPAMRSADRKGKVKKDLPVAAGKPGMARRFR
jgi:5-methylcytosine-specific restriction protein A